MPARPLKLGERRNVSELKLGCVWNGWLKNNKPGWRDGSVVKSADCSSQGREFKSQQPHSGSQPSVMDLMPSSGVSEDSYSILIYNK